MKYQGIISAILLFFAAFAATASPVDINQADAKTLAAELTGIGQAKAAAIVAYREANGPFKQVDELAKVKGIGNALVERNRVNLLVSQHEDER